MSIDYSSSCSAQFSLFCYKMKIYICIWQMFENFEHNLPGRKAETNSADPDQIASKKQSKKQLDQGLPCLVL